MEGLDQNFTAKMLDFCINYTTKGETYSNITLSYANAYDYELPRDEKGKIIINSKEYNACASNGSRLFKNDKIQAKIREIFLSRLEDNVIDARLAEIVTEGNETNSVQAIKIYNDLKNRITKRIDLTTGGRPLAGLNDDELKKLAE